MSTADLSIATRAIVNRSLKNQVFIDTPFYDEIVRRNKLVIAGGKTFDRLVDKDEMDDLAQYYDENTALTDGKKDFLARPSFNWKQMQVPLVYGVDEQLQNVDAMNEEQLLDLAEHLAQKGLRATKLSLMKAAWNNGTDTPIESSNTKSFQSIVSALDFDNTYGGITRTGATGVNNYWQGAMVGAVGTPEGTAITDTNATAYNLSIDQWRQWLIPVEHRAESLSDLITYMPASLFNKFRAEAEARVLYRPGDPQRQGFETMFVDGRAIVKVPYLEEQTNTKTWVSIINHADWELRIHTSRNFEMTDFVWQGDRANGFDKWIARILVSGNLVCWKPNGSMWLNNVS
jgi:hypothetical protein